MPQRIRDLKTLIMKELTLYLMVHQLQNTVSEFLVNWATLFYLSVKTWGSFHNLSLLLFKKMINSLCWYAFYYIKLINVIIERLRNHQKIRYSYSISCSNCIGEGSYSSVYKVKRKSDGLEYALKKVKMDELSEKEKTNSLNEIRILASIKHPNIISYKEAFIEENILW